MANSNQQRPVKKIKVIEDDDTDHHNQEQVLCHDFLNEAPEDILARVLVDSRSAARASTVCRRWHSSIRRNPRQLIERFKSHHPPKYSLPWAVVFRPIWCSEANNCHVSSDDWLFLHGKLPENCFDFLPNSSNMHIKASCNDLFLVGGIYEDDLYICNPITKQFLQVPAGPCLENTTSHRGVKQIAYAVVRTTANMVRFKVVKVLLFNRHSSLPKNFNRIVTMAVFCSVSRKWETRSLPCPGIDSGWYEGYHHTYNVVTVDGVLYWLSRRGDYGKILLYLDLSKEKCGIIDFPGPAHLFGHHSIGAIPMSGGSHELRLLKVETYANGIVNLTVWRLNSNNNSNDGDSNLINIVHDERTLARPDNMSERACSFQGAFVHPTMGDLVLCVWGINVFEYNLVDSTYNKIAELSRTDSRAIEKPPFLMVSASDSPAGFGL